MTRLKEKAVDLLQQIPEDRMVYVVNVLQNIGKEGDVTEQEDARKALQNILKYKGKLRPDFDEKRELAEGREEKYGNSD